MSFKTRLTLLTVLLLIVAGTFGWLVRGGYLDLEQAAAARLQTGTQIGNLAPDFTLKELGGSDLTLSDLKGKRVFVNFWATWCPPCRAEMPHIQAVYEEKEDDVVFLAINLGESESKVEAFLEKNGYTFPVLMDPKGQTASLYLVRAIPTSYVIDADGIVRGKHIGVLSKATLTKLLESAKDKYTE